MEKVKIGMIGCGNISDWYLRNLMGKIDNLELAACSDIIREKAVAKAEQYGIPKVCTTEEMLADPEIRMILNITIPKVHFEVTMKSLEAGKHVYVEKPLTINREDGQKVLEKAREKGLLVGCAPDTVLGVGIQTSVKLVNDGIIGKPIGAAAFFTGHGPENGHPDPDFYYKPGGGPVFDMGPYYLTALISLIGPVKRVTGSATMTFPERIITSGSNKGKTIKVEVPTHVAGIIEFESGAIATVLTSFDVWASQLPRIELYGTEGSMMVPDPNQFTGKVFIKKSTDNDWIEMTPADEFSANGRGIGLSDMVYAIQNNRPHRASGELGYHVLDIMHSLHEASKEGRWLDLKSTCRRPQFIGGKSGL